MDCEKKFEQHTMYKVYYFVGENHELHEALFDDKYAAQEFCKWCSHLEASMNRWLWDVHVEM